MSPAGDIIPRADGCMKYCLYDRGGEMIMRYNLDKYTRSVKSGRSHTYPVMKIAVIKEGEADWRFTNAVYHSSPGDIVILRPNEPRTVENIKGEYLSCDMFSFTFPALSTNDRCAELFFGVSGDCRELLVGSHETAPEIRGLLSRAAEELMAGRPFCADMSLSLLTQAVVLICRAFGMEMSGKYHSVEQGARDDAERKVYDREKSCQRRKSESGVSFIIADAADFIKRECGNSISIEDLAARANMSRSTFFRHFRAQTGTTVNSYIQRCRVERVIERMSERRGNILDIAMSCGFSSSSAFYSAFRSVTGMSPHELKHAVENGESPESQ